MTALAGSYQYTKNQSGNAFKDTAGNNKGLDNSRMPEVLANALKENLNAELYGVLDAYAENSVIAGIGFVPVKAAHGNLDSEGIWVGDMNSVAQVSQNNGSIEYRLSVTNMTGQDQKYVMLFDILPFIGDLNGSQWELVMDTDYEITAVKTAADKTTSVVELEDENIIFGNWTSGKTSTNALLRLVQSFRRARTQITGSIKRQSTGLAWPTERKALKMTSLFQEMQYIVIRSKHS